jgi:tRNA (adenine57-N1/adenine58-N1)-methyltransferase
VLPALRRALEPGAVLCCYLPTTGQLQRLAEALGREGFLHLDTFEVLVRPWHLSERSVRPEHRMVAHTGFLSVARRLP